MMYHFRNAKEIYIYGASYIGSVTGRALMNRGIQIKGYIDQRAEEIRACNGLPVYSIPEFQTVATSDAVIFVAVKNVYYHKEIAKTLHQCGYERIIYKSDHAINGSMAAQEEILDQAYECIYKTGGIPEFEIPTVNPGNGLVWKDNPILRESDEFVTIDVPMEQLYTGITADPWKDVLILALLPHIRMFQYFDGQRKEMPFDYISLCEEGARKEKIKITHGWKKYVLENRFHIYEQMRWRYEHEPDYFIDQAPLVSWNERGYFNLLTGKHRICFLAAMNRTSAPVKIKKDVWKDRSLTSETAEIKHLLEKNTDQKFPIPHFLYQGNIQYHCMFRQQQLRRILNQMYDQELMHGRIRKTCKIYNLIPEGGYFSTIFSQMGFEIYGNALDPVGTELYMRLGMAESDISNFCGKQLIVLAEKESGVNSIQLPKNTEIFKIYTD